MPTNKLQIGVGRYCNTIIPRDERYCIICHNVVEDLMNIVFLFVCPLNFINNDEVNIVHFIITQAYLINPTDFKSTRNTCNFIHDPYYIGKSIYLLNQSSKLNVCR